MRIRRPVALATDTVLVAVFSVLGRLAHKEGLAPGEVWATLWPFLVGLGAGWVVVSATRRPAGTVRTGLVVWLCTLGGGMLIRGIRDGRVPHWSFILFAGVVTLAFLVGWRAVAGRLARRDEAPARTS